MKKQNYKLPKGYKVWKKIENGAFGAYSVITQKKDRIVLFHFDGFNETPISIEHFLIKK